MKHNAHVILYKKILLWIATKQNRHMAQLVYYTELQKEIDPDWTPYDDDKRGGGK